MQQSNMQIKAQASQLCRVAAKPENERMPFQGVQIAKSLQRITFLSKYIDMKSEQFINLCISSKLIQFQPYTKVYQMEKTRYVYIILQGRVKVSLRTDGNEAPYQTSKHFLSEFGIFGETEILLGMEQRMEIVTTENQIVKCLVFEQEQIKRLINPGMINFIDKAYKYLQGNEYFDELSKFEKYQLITYMKLVSFSKMDRIIEAGTQINFVIFIIYGQISVIKEMGMKGSMKKEMYKIDDLSEMNSFGEYECIKRLQASHILIAKSSGSYYSLDYEGLKHSNHKILSIIMQNALPYPDQQQLNFLHLVKTNLKTQQAKIIKKNRLF